MLDLSTLIPNLYEQPPTGIGPLTSNPPNITYAIFLKPTPSIKKPILLKPISYFHGKPRILWEQEEVDQMIVNENLQCDRNILPWLARYSRSEETDSQTMRVKSRV